MGKDYYKTLGVDKSASKEEIRRAYKLLAKKYHPDNKDTGSEEKFKEISEAASILGDDQKRQQFDQFGSEGFQGGGFSDFDSSSFNNFGFEDIIDQFFGGGKRRGRRGGPQRGSDLRYDIEITLKEAGEGITKNIIIPKLDTCDKCEGTGSRDASDLKTCDTCQGTGAMKRVTRTPFGMFQQQSVCSTCKGEGRIIKNPCSKCHGEGRTEVSRKIEVNIPAGVDNETQLRLSNQGEAGSKGGPKGDLYVIVYVKKHPEFERDGDDLYTETTIPFTTAILGGEIEIETLTGSAKLKIPQGTQPETILSMKNLGMPNLRGHGKGSQNVKIIIDIPTKLSKEQKKAIQDFEKAKKKGIFGF